MQKSLGEEMYECIGNYGGVQALHNCDVIACVSVCVTA